MVQEARNDVLFWGVEQDPECAADVDRRLRANCCLLIVDALFRGSI